MVHALQRAGIRLRPGGTLISIRPHWTWRPSIAIVANGRRLPVTELLTGSFESNLDSAEAALERVVNDGWFALARVQAARWRTYLDRPSQMRTYLELITPPRPRFPPGARAHLYRLWASMPRGARIEITEPLVMTALRRRWRSNGRSRLGTLASRRDYVKRPSTAEPVDAKIGVQRENLMHVSCLGQ